jgi:hypothetical protein
LLFFAKYYAEADQKKVFREKIANIAGIVLQVTEYTSELLYLKGVKL